MLLLNVSLYFIFPSKGLQLEEVGDFGDENCALPLNLIRCSKFYFQVNRKFLLGAVIRWQYYQFFLLLNLGQYYLLDSNSKLHKTNKKLH